jgi:uncharacterized protein (TIGR03790 family)
VRRATLCLTSTLGLCSLAACSGAADAPTVLLPKSGLEAAEVAVVVNDNDPQSVAVAAYYQERRGIPAQNLIHVQLPSGAAVLASADFAAVKATVDAALPPGIQAFALTWTLPYRVDCMSITSAFALGFDTKYCNTSGSACAMTAAVDYHASNSLAPYDDFGIRPAMSLAGTSADNVKALIDRGVAADATFPGGTGYFVATTDSARSVRQGDFQSTVEAWSYDGGLDLLYIDNTAGQAANAIKNKQDVLFYFTGLASVPDIATNTYLPGAVADHLTSYGGALTGGGQMSVLRWLEAGATASYGTVVEPCNFTAKFPSPGLMLPFYFRGATVLEAYWKSVAWPGEGIFVGEPLARPWGAASVTFKDNTVTIETNQLDPARLYQVEAADSAKGPFTPVLTGITVPHYERARIVVPGATRAYYRLSAVLSSPTGLRADLGGTGSQPRFVALSWDHVTGVSFFRVYRSSEAAGPASDAAPIAIASSPSGAPADHVVISTAYDQAEGLVADATYYYRVSACDGVRGERCGPMSNMAAVLFK